MKTVLFEFTFLGIYFSRGYIDRAPRPPSITMYPLALAPTISFIKFPPPGTIRLAMAFLKKQPPGTKDPKQGTQKHENHEIDTGTTFDFHFFCGQGPPGTTTWNWEITPWHLGQSRSKLRIIN